jgi:GNAT superfamily N-acetyltransferase
MQCGTSSSHSASSRRELRLCQAVHVRHSATFSLQCQHSVQVMVAEPRSRRKGIAAEALRLMMAYAIHFRGARGFTAKISSGNAHSRKLFHKLGFVLVKDMACFDEVHYSMSEADSPAAWGALVQAAHGIEQQSMPWEPADSQPAANATGSHQ